jgi:hypothetical protein
VDHGVQAVTLAAAEALVVEAQVIHGDDKL